MEREQEKIQQKQIQTNNSVNINMIINKVIGKGLTFSTASILLLASFKVALQVDFLQGMDPKRKC